MLLRKSGTRTKPRWGLRPLPLLSSLLESIRMPKLAKPLARTPAKKVENPTVSERVGYLGGSDASAIMGASPFATPLQVYADKKGVAAVRRFDDVTEMRFFFGHLMEPAIAKAVEHFHGVKSVVDPKFLRAKKPLQFMGGHLDFRVPKEKTFLECKNIRHPSNEWGPMPDASTEDGALLVPKYYLAQCDHYMVVVDAREYCYLAALMGGCELRLYRIYRDEKREKALIAAEQAFWNRVLVDDPPIGSSADDFTLALRLGYVEACTKKEAKKKDPIIVGKDVADWLRELNALRTQNRKFYKEEQAIKGKILESVHDLGLLCDNDGEIIGSILSRKRAGFDDFALKMAHPDLFEKFETRTTFPMISVENKETDSEEESDV